MATSRFKTAWNYDHTAIKRERNTMPGKTIPDQSLSVRQIMERHTSGVPLNVKTPQFHNDEEIENFDGKNPATMDISEIHEELTEIAERQKERIRTAEETRTEQKRQDEIKLMEAQKAKWEQEYISKQNPKPNIP